MQPPLTRYLIAIRPSLGCDPELFFKKGGEVIGAEKVLDRFGGVLRSDSYAGGSTIPKGFNERAVVIDGVQVELNPSPNTCRALLGAELAATFRTLRTTLLAMPEVTASFSSVIEVSKAELDSLSDKAKVFGCAPSFNLYDKEARVSVDAGTYLKRSAGGHIHIGALSTNVFAQRERLIPILDAVVGNTCVLLDRDPEAAERRRVYGRAGEYRLPPHGIEYRTLSNFWLRAYPLMSFVMGASRESVAILENTLVHSNPNLYYSDYNWDAEKELLSQIDHEKVREAINTNNRELALENWQVVKVFFARTLGTQTLATTRLDKLDLLFKDIEEKGLEKVFPEDPLTHWCSIVDGHGKGWESFIDAYPNPIPAPAGFATTNQAVTTAPPF